MSESRRTVRLRGAGRAQAVTSVSAIATIARRFIAVTISADAVPLNLGSQPFAAGPKALPGDSLACIAADHQDEIVPIFQSATEHFRVLEIDGQPLRSSRRNAFAGSREIRKENALIRANRAEAFRTDVENVLRPKLHRLSLLIEKHGADRTGSALQQLTQNVLEGHLGSAAHLLFDHDVAALDRLHERVDYAGMKAGTGEALHLL